MRFFAAPLCIWWLLHYLLLHLWCVSSFESRKSVCLFWLQNSISGTKNSMHLRCILKCNELCHCLRKSFTESEKEIKGNLNEMFALVSVAGKFWFRICSFAIVIQVSSLQFAMLTIYILLAIKIRLPRQARIYANTHYQPCEWSDYGLLGF